MAEAENPGDSMPIVVSSCRRRPAHLASTSMPVMKMDTPYDDRFPISRPTPDRKLILEVKTDFSPLKAALFVLQIVPILGESIYWHDPNPNVLLKNVGQIVWHVINVGCF
jgi:hypothetical protein